MSTRDSKHIKTDTRLVTGPNRERLDSWKEIAAYLCREVRTAQRWEKREGMPIHRHIHDKASTVWAFKNEIDDWLHSRRRVTSKHVSKDDCKKLADQLRSPTLLEPAGVEATSRSWLQDTAVEVGALDLVQGEQRIRLYLYVDLLGERNSKTTVN